MPTLASAGLAPGAAIRAATWWGHLNLRPRCAHRRGAPGMQLACWLGGCDVLGISRQRDHSTSRTSILATLCPAAHAPLASARLPYAPTRGRCTYFLHDGFAWD